MPFLVLLILFIVFVVLPRIFKTRGPLGDSRTRLLASGLPARGLVLRASASATSTVIGNQRFQLRNVLLDVEVSGRDPYEVSLSAPFPRLCESFPGTALDLRVSPTNPEELAIVGPAGSSAWIGEAAWLLQPQGIAQTPQNAASGCGTVVIVLVTLGLAAGAGLSFAIGGASHERPAHDAPHAESPAITAPTSAPISWTCEAAIRCCKVLGRARCTAYESMSEVGCKSALKEETKAAAKMGKTCK